MKYKIYFELFGKRMVTTVDARSIEDAKKQVKDKIVFHKVEQDIDFLKNIFNIK
jgi:fructose-1,6-bisphosphatase